MSTTDFDEDFYAMAYPDLLKAKLLSKEFNLEQHFISAGATEGRVGNAQFDSKIWSEALFSDHAPHISQLVAAGLIKSSRPFAFVHGLESYGDVLSSDVVTMLASLAGIDLGIAFDLACAVKLGEVSVLTKGSLPDQKWLSFEIADEFIEERDITEFITAADHAIILPWFGRGGAEKVAFSHYNVLTEVLQCSAILIATDTETDIISGYFPTTASTLDLARLVPLISGRPYSELSVDEKVDILADVIRRTGAKTVHVVNSFIGFEAIKRRVFPSVKVIASLFCFHQEPDGQLTGYARSIRQMDDTIFVTDSEAFQQILIHVLGVPASRVISLRYPVEQHPSFLPTRSESRNATSVLWASRLDFQKQPELVFDIARRLPDITFHMYGSSIMADFATREETPSNVVLQGAFTSFGEIPVEEYICFLYTSRFDGKPNIVLEAAASGLAIISSNVGGVGEVLSGGRGVLIEDCSDADAFVSAIRLLQSDFRFRKATAVHGMSYVQIEHSRQSFELEAEKFYRLIESQ